MSVRFVKFLKVETLLTTKRPPITERSFQNITLLAFHFCLLTSKELFFLIKLQHIPVSHQQFELFLGAYYQVVEFAHTGTGRD